MSFRASFCPLDNQATAQFRGTAGVVSVNGKTGVVALTPADVGAIPAPASPTSGDVLTYNGTAWAADALPSDVFIAKYGVTTSAEIYAAFQAGKMCFCQYDLDVNNHYLYCLRYVGSSTYFTFFNVNPSAVGTYTCNNDVWSSSSSQFAPISSPTFSGTPTAPTATAGTNTTQIATTAFVKTAVDNYTAPVTSVNSQTGDVSLSIPSTAADVGAIAAPSSPSSGDILTYNGTAWAADALPSDVAVFTSSNKASDVEAAYQAGKAIYHYNSTYDVYAPLYRRNSASNFTFAVSYGTTYYTFGVEDYPNSTVWTNFHGKVAPVTPDTPSNGQVLVYKSSAAGYKPTTLPAAKIPDAPTTDGTYSLQVTVASGEPTYSWVAVT